MLQVLCLNLKPCNQKVNFIVHEGNDKNTWENIKSPGSLNKFFRAKVARTFSSMLLDDSRISKKWSSKQLLAITLIPVSGRRLRICMSHVAITRQDLVIFTDWLIRHSSRALKMAPFSWLQSTNATLFSQLLVAFASSSWILMSKARLTKLEKTLKKMFHKKEWAQIKQTSFASTASMEIPVPSSSSKMLLSW